jgi:single-stranded-DNA-specific exonuclease
MQQRWILPPVVDAGAVKALSLEFGVPQFVAEFLVRKEIATPELAALFLQPRLRSLGDPNLLPQISAAVVRIEAALRNNESILLFGDYDVDGVASLAVLYRTLIAYGARVNCFLPMRAEEGYGLSEAGVARCLSEYQPGLLIAVDCGTNSTAEIARLGAAGIDVVVLDHHEPGTELPDCCALVNPKVAGENYSYLCSAGIAFKTAHALLKSSPLPGFQLKELLDLVALATLCDLVPVVGENRILVRHGLQQMAVTRWPGLAALMAISGVKPPVCGADAGFRLGPRINAAGRLGTAWDALQLLLTNNPSEATTLAAKLECSNRERQAVERTVSREVEDWIATHFDPARHTAIVVGAREWHTGVLGIVASRVMRRHHRPSLIIGFDESGAGRGSGRSIEGFSLVDALGQCAGCLEQFGGHEMAAGVTLHESRFEEFRAAFDDTARRLTTPEMLVPRLHLDAELDLNDFTDAFLDAQSALEPFGNSNTQPVLFARNVRPVSAPRVVKEKHLRLQFSAGRNRIDSIFFNGAVDPLPSPPWDIAFHLERNAYNGRVSPQLQILDVRATR